MLNILLIDNDLVSIDKVFNAMTSTTEFECKVEYICRTQSEIEFCIQKEQRKISALFLRYFVGANSVHPQFHSFFEKTITP